MTRDEIERVAKVRAEEAFKYHAAEANELCIAVTGADVFVWSRLTPRQLRTLSRLLFTLCLEARGT